MPRLSLLGVLRTVSVLLAALLVATVLPRFGLPVRFLPDLVVVLVVSTAVLRGPTHGALVGLAAGWVVDLVPPAGAPLGVTALLYAGAGAAAGTFRRPGCPGTVPPVLALTVAAGAVAGGGWCVAVLGTGTLDTSQTLTRLASTLVVGVACLPILVTVDRALTRRRLA